MLYLMKFTIDHLAWSFVCFLTNILLFFFLLLLVFLLFLGDECHYLKSADAQRTKNILPILKNVKRRVLLSGTPALSRYF